MDIRSWVEDGVDKITRNNKTYSMAIKLKIRKLFQKIVYNRILNNRNKTMASKTTKALTILKKNHISHSMKKINEEDKFKGNFF